MFCWAILGFGEGGKDFRMLGILASFLLLGRVLVLVSLSNYSRGSTSVWNGEMKKGTLKIREWKVNPTIYLSKMTITSPLLIPNRAKW